MDIAQGQTYNRHRTKRNAAFVAHHRKVFVFTRDPNGVSKLPIDNIILVHVLDEFFVLLQCLDVARMIHKNQGERCGGLLSLKL